MTAGMTAQTTALERFDELGRRLVRALGEQLLQLHVKVYGTTQCPASAGRH